MDVKEWCWGKSDAPAGGSLASLSPSVSVLLSLAVSCIPLSPLPLPSCQPPHSCPRQFVMSPQAKSWICSLDTFRNCSSVLVATCSPASKGVGRAFEDSSYTWTLNNTGLSCAGPLMHRFFSINIVPVFSFYRSLSVGISVCLMRDHKMWNPKN